MDSQELTDSAPLLFSHEIMDALQNEEAKGIYTAERLKSQRPEIHHACIELLGRDMSQAAIARTLGVHHRTVAAIALSQANSIDAIRSKVAAKLMLAGTLQVERLIDNPDMVPWNVAGLAAVQLLDKAQLLSGGPTQIIEERQGKLSPEQFNEMLKALPEADAQVLAATDCGGEKSGANGVDRGGSGSGMDEGETGASDFQSLGCLGQTAIDTLSDPLSADQAGGLGPGAPGADDGQTAKTGGAGVENFEGGPATADW